MLGLRLMAKKGLDAYDLDLGLDTRYNDFMKSKTWVKAKEQGYSL